MRMTVVAADTRSGDNQMLRERTMDEDGESKGRTLCVNLS
jgi:hypothetical protein